MTLECREIRGWNIKSLCNGQHCRRSFLNSLNRCVFCGKRELLFKTPLFSLVYETISKHYALCKRNMFETFWFFFQPPNVWRDPLVWKVLIKSWTTEWRKTWEASEQMKKETKRVEREGDDISQNFIYFIILVLFENFSNSKDTFVSIPKKRLRESRKLYLELPCQATDSTSLESKTCLMDQLLTHFCFLYSEVSGLITRLLWSSLEKSISVNAFGRRRFRKRSRHCKILIIKAFCLSLSQNLTQARLCFY